MAESTGEEDDALGALCLSIRNDAADSVRRCLYDRPDLNRVWEKEQITPLSLACSLGSVEMVVLLIGCGADVAHVGPDGKSALHHTCCLKDRKPEHFDVLDLLLRAASSSRGAVLNVDRRDNMECTALFYACQSDDVKIVQRLLELGADANASTVEGDTPLKVACRNAEFRFFWKGRCDPGSNEDLDPGGFPSVQIAKALLIAGATAEATFLPTAVQFAAVDLLMELLALGMDVNMQDDNQRTPLGCACSSSSVDPQTARLLLDHGADVNKGGGWKKQKPVIFAYVHNSVEKIRLLLSYGATVTADEMTELVSMTLSKSFLENPDVVGPRSKELAAWRLLSQAGFRPRLDVLHSKRRSLHVMSSYASISTWIDNFFYPVRSLRECCRLAIRASVRPVIDRNVTELPLPPRLIQFLQFAEFS